MLLGRKSGHRLEPVCEMRRAMLDRPLLHHRRNRIRHVKLQMAAVFNCLMNRLIYVLRQTFLHNLIVEYQAAEDFRNGFHKIKSFFFHFFYLLFRECISQQ